MFLYPHWYVYPIKIRRRKSNGYNLFDINDKFYTDICTPYKSKNGTDILLFDRYNDYYKSNQLNCQENCNYSNYSIETQYLKCECNVVNQNKIELEESEKLTDKSIVKSFVNVFKYSNYKVLKCYKLVFRKKTFYENIGSILSIIYLIGFLISFIIFCFNRINYISLEIQKLFEIKNQEIIMNKKKIMRLILIKKKLKKRIKLKLKKMKRI